MVRQVVTYLLSLGFVPRVYEFGCNFLSSSNVLNDVIAHLMDVECTERVLFL